MASFTERFDTLGNQTLDGYNGWNSLPNTGTDLEVYDRTVRANITAKLIAARQETTLPATVTQKVRASVACMESGAESSTSHVIIGVSDLRSGNKNASTMTDWGYGVGVTFGTSGSRQLFILRDAGTAGGYAVGAYTELARTEVGDSVPTESKNNNKVLKVGASDYGVLQDLRMRLDVVAEGVRVRAYLNQDDDDAPGVEVIDGLDIVKEADVPLGGNRPGWWFLALGACPLARGLAIGEFDAEDFELFTPAAERRDTLTLKDIVDMAKLRYEGATNASDFDDGLARQFANDAQNELIAEAGQEASFATVQESLALTIAENGRSTLPAHVDQVLAIHESTGNPVPWYYAGKASNGGVLVDLVGFSSQSFLVTFIAHIPKMAVDRDHSVIPRKHAEALVLGVCRRFAMYDRNYQTAIVAEWTAALSRFKADQKRMQRGALPRLKVPTRQIALGYNDPLANVGV